MANRLSNYPKDMQQSKISKTPGGTPIIHGPESAAFEQARAVEQATTPAGKILAMHLFDVAQNQIVKKTGYSVEFVSRTIRNYEAGLVDTSGEVVDVA